MGVNKKFLKKGGQNRNFAPKPFFSLSFSFDLPLLSLSSSPPIAARPLQKPAADPEETTRSLPPSSPFARFVGVPRRRPCSDPRRRPRSDPRRQSAVRPSGHGGGSCSRIAARLEVASLK